jgi:hypothetical protein
MLGTRTKSRSKSDNVGNVVQCPKRHLEPATRGVEWVDVSPEALSLLSVSGTVYARRYAFGYVGYLRMVVVQLGKIHSASAGRERLKCLNFSNRIQE